MRHYLALLVSLAVVLALLAPAPPPVTESRDNPLGSEPSVNPPEANATLRLHAAGKVPADPFPNYVNRSHRFNPTGTAIPKLSPGGEQKILVLFVDFPNTPPGGPDGRLDLGLFDDLLFGTAYDPPEYAAYGDHPTDRTLANYYAEVTYGQIMVSTLDMPSSVGWAQAAQPYEYYCQADGVHDSALGPFPRNGQGLVIDAIDAADASVDFAKYAVNGEIPNLLVVHAGGGAEWGWDPRLIWSQNWNLSDGTGLDGGYVVDGVKVNNYALLPEVGGDLLNYSGFPTGPFPPTVGVFAHEFGHVLGLPDLYDYGHDTQGLGNYSLMASGSWNGYPLAPIFYGNSPAHPDAWSKYQLGVLSPIEVTATTVASLPPVETDPVAYRMTVPFSDGKEYFLLENRQAIGFDEGLMGFQPYFDPLNPHGLAIYHVDETVLSRNYWWPNEAENYKERALPAPGKRGLERPTTRSP